MLAVRRRFASIVSLGLVRSDSMTRESIPAPITAADESFHHQMVAPAAVTAHVDPAWAERGWHLVNLGGGWVLGTGRALWPHDGRRTAVAGLNTGRTQYARRVAEPRLAGDDPDHPTVGPIRIEAVDPLRRIRLVLDDPDAPFGFDLTYVARFPAVPTGRNRIERHGVVVTDYMNFFQSGRYSGTVVADGEQRLVENRRGFRDRGWGLRKHEGASRRGMHVFTGCELEDEAIYILLYENAAGQRMFTNGWTMNASGVTDLVIGADHDLQLDGRRLIGGELRVTFESGRRRTIGIEAEGRLFMETVGYTAVAGRADPGIDRFDVSDPVVAAELDGLFDNACNFSVDGDVGHGLVEIGLGTHARYLPEGDA